MHYAPCFVIPHGLSTLYRCLLTTVAQSKSYHEKPFNHRLLQPQGALYPIQTILNHHSRDKLLEFRSSFHETIGSDFLVQGNFKHIQFSWEHQTWRDSNSQPHAPTASAVPVELTWLVKNVVRTKQQKYIYKKVIFAKMWDTVFIISRGIFRSSHPQPGGPGSHYFWRPGAKLKISPSPPFNLAPLKFSSLLALEWYPSHHDDLPLSFCPHLFICLFVCLFIYFYLPSFLPFFCKSYHKAA